MRFILSSLFVIFSLTVFAQSCIGKWVTIDDKTKKKKSVVELYKKEGKLYGKIIYLFPREGREDNPKCKECKGDMKDQPLVGLKIVRDLEWDGKAWSDGEITDPEEGKDYTVKMWLSPKKPDILCVRGYIGPFYRTQYWVRLKDK